MNFSDRLFRACLAKDSAVVAGIDPDPLAIPRAYFPDPFPGANRREAVAKGIVAFAGEVIGAVRDIAVAIKPQLAHFERFGPPGLWAFEEVVKLGREAGLLVIADGKRNDIGSTAEMYASAYLGARRLPGGDGTPGVPGEPGAGDLATLVAGAEMEGPKADALTVNPYLGWDGIEPFLDRGGGEAGVFVLVKTSNPSSGELQDLKISGSGGEGETSRGGGPGETTVAGVVAAAIERACLDRPGELGYGPVGAVVGATYPEELESLRRLMPHAPILIPGYGAQGGTAEDVARGFGPDGLGAVVNASRSILYAFRRGGSVGEAARRAATAMRDEIRRAVAQRASERGAR